MRIMRLGLMIGLAAALTASSAAGGTIVVDPAGGGNFDNIPEAMFRGSAEDTVLVVPGYYEVETGIPYPWPVSLTSDSPTLVSQGGASSPMGIPKAGSPFEGTRGWGCSKGVCSSR